MKKCFEPNRDGVDTVETSAKKESPKRSSFRNPRFRKARKRDSEIYIYIYIYSKNTKTSRDPKTAYIHKERARENTINDPIGVEIRDFYRVKNK